MLKRDGIQRAKLTIPYRDRRAPAVQSNMVYLPQEQLLVLLSSVSRQINANR